MAEADTKATKEEGVVEIETKEKWDEYLVKNKDKLLVLDCFATWCGPCKVVAPIVLKYSKTYPEAAFFKLDVDKVPEVAGELGVRAMPTFGFFKNGEKVDEVIGANPLAIEAAIKKYI